MKVDSSASYFLRQAATVVAVTLCVSGCSAAGEASGDHTIDNVHLPFTFRVPSDFTKEPVDDINSRGDVVVGAGISKLDVIAVRRVAAGQALPRGDVRHSVEGKSVTSRLHRVAGGFAIECQWTADRREKVLAACAEAVGSIVRR